MSATAIALVKDEEKYATEIYKNWRKIFNFVHQMVSKTDDWPPEVDTEDIVQETFLKAFNSKSFKAKNGALLSTWLYRIAQNLIVSTLRNYNRRKKNIRNFSHTLRVCIVYENSGKFSYVPVEIYTPEKSFFVSEIRAELRTHDPMTIEIFYMRQSGIPYDEIATELGVSVQAAKLRMHRLKKEICRIIEGEIPCKATQRRVLMRKCLVNSSNIVGSSTSSELIQ